MATSYSVFIDLQTKGASNTSKQIKDMGDKSKVASNSLGLLKSSLGFLGIGLGTVEILKAADGWTTYANTIKASSEAGTNLIDVQNKLFAIAQGTSTSLKGTSDTYRALALNMGELGASQKDLLAVTQAITEGISQSGTTAQQARGGIIQLGQVFEKGTLQAQEYNSVITDFPALGSKLKKFFLDASGGTETMRAQMLQGKISSRQFFKALLDIAPELDNMQSSMQRTNAQGVVRLSNSFDKLVGSMDSLLQESTGINSFADSLTGVMDGISGLFESLKSGEQTVRNFSESIREMDFSKFVSGIIPAKKELESFLHIADRANNAQFGLADGTLKKTQPLLGTDSDVFKSISNKGKIDSAVQAVENTTKEISINKQLDSELNRVAVSALAIADTSKKSLSVMKGQKETVAETSNNYVTYLKQLETVRQQLLGISPMMQKIKSDASLTSGQTFKLAGINEANQQIKEFIRTSSEISDSNTDIINLGSSYQKLKDDIAIAATEMNTAASNGNKVEASQKSLNTIAKDKSMINLYKSLNNLSNDLASSFADSMSGLVTGTLTASQAFKQMASSIISDMIRMGIEAEALNAIKGLGSLFGGLFGSVGSSVASSASGAVASSAGGNLLSGTRGLSLQAANDAAIPLSSSFNRSNVPVQMVVNTNITSDNGGSGSSNNAKSQSEQATDISKLVNAKITEKLIKESRVGGLLHRG